MLSPSSSNIAHSSEFEQWLAEMVVASPRAMSAPSSSAMAVVDQAGAQRCGRGDASAALVSAIHALIFALRTAASKCSVLSWTSAASASASAASRSPSASRARASTKRVMPTPRRLNLAGVSAMRRASWMASAGRPSSSSLFQDAEALAVQFGAS